MPYSSTEDLPASVRSALPDGGQRIFLAAFNAAYEGTCKNDPDLEECANRVAWAAVKEKYEKSGDGWVEHTRKERKCPPGVFNCTAPAIDTPGPRAILNVLDTFQHFPNPKYPDGLHLWYGANEFAGTESALEAVPLIFAQAHPDGKQILNGDLPGALASVRTYDGRPGRTVGALERAAIIREGQPRIEVGLQFTDPEVERLWHENKLSLSSSNLFSTDPFPGMPENYRKARPDVRPNHVLVFVRSPRDLPGDPGAMFLNNKKEFTEMAEEPTKTTPPVSPLEQRFAEMESELRNMKAAYNQVMADTKVKDEKIALAEKDGKDRQWSRIAEVLPRGWVHGTEEVKSRELFEKQPAEFVLKLVSTLRETHTKEVEKAGEEYQRKHAAPPKKLGDVCTALVVNGKAVGDES